MRDEGVSILTIGGFEHFLNSTRTARAVHLDIELVIVFRHLAYRVPNRGRI